MSETERAGVCTCGRVVFSFDIELSILGVILWTMFGRGLLVISDVGFLPILDILLIPILPLRRRLLPVHSNDFPNILGKLFLPTLATLAQALYGPYYPISQLEGCKRMDHEYQPST